MVALAAEGRSPNARNSITGRCGKDSEIRLQTMGRNSKLHDGRSLWQYDYLGRVSLRGSTHFSHSGNYEQVRAHSHKG